MWLFKGSPPKQFLVVYPLRWGGGLSKRTFFVHFLYMSYLVFVLSMSCLCPAYVLTMPCLCLVYVFYMPCLCLVYALSMPLLCLVYVLSISCQFLVYILSKSCLVNKGIGRFLEKLMSHYE